MGDTVIEELIQHRDNALLSMKYELLYEKFLNEEKA